MRRYLHNKETGEEIEVTANNQDSLKAEYESNPYLYELQIEETEDIKPGTEGKTELFAQTSSPTIPISETTQQQSAPFVPGTSEYIAKEKAEKGEALEDVRTRKIDLFINQWDKMPIQDKALYLAEKMGKSNVEGIAENIATFPNEALSNAVSYHLDEEEPGYLRRTYERGKDILGAPGRLLGSALDVALSPTEFEPYKVSESFAKRGAETERGVPERSLFGGIGQDVIRDPYNIPLTVAGAPLSKGIASGSARLFQNIAPEAGRAAKFAYAPIRSAAMGIPEGIAESGLQSLDEYLMRGKTDLLGSLASGALYGGLIPAGMTTAGSVAGDVLQKTGLDRLTRSVKKKYGATRPEDLQETTLRAKIASDKALDEFNEQTRKRLESGRYQQTESGLYDNEKRQYVTGGISRAPKQAYMMRPLSAAEMVTNVSDIKDPSVMSSELGERLGQLTDIRSQPLTSEKPLTSIEYEDIFERTKETLDKLLKNEQLFPRQYKTAVSELKGLKEDIPLERLSKSKTKGLKPLTAARSLMDVQQKFNVSVKDNKIDVYDKTKSFSPSDLTKSIYRDELNQAIGLRTPFARQVERSYMAPMIASKKAIDDLKVHGSRSIFDIGKDNSLAVGLGAATVSKTLGPAAYFASKVSRAATQDPFGLKSLRLSEKLSPAIYDPALEANILERGVVRLFEGQPTINQGWTDEITGAGQRRLADPISRTAGTIGTLKAYKQFEKDDEIDERYPLFDGVR